MSKLRLADLSHLLTTSDSKGNLMPSYLLTAYSDTAKDLGLAEDVVDVDTGLNWIRLTDAGLIAKERASR
jgi:hypothetical protein